MRSPQLLVTIDKRENYDAVRELLHPGVKDSDIRNLLDSVEGAIRELSTVPPNQDASAETYDLKKQDLTFVVYDEDKKDIKELCCKEAYHLRLGEVTELIKKITGDPSNGLTTTRTNTSNTWKNDTFFIKQIKEGNRTPLQSAFLGEAILSSHLGTRDCGPQNTKLYYQWWGGSNTYAFYLKTDVADNDLHSWFKGPSTETNNSNNPVFVRHEREEVQLMAKACEEAIQKISYEARVLYMDNRPDNWVYTQGKNKKYTVLACDSGAGLFFVPAKDHDLDLLYVCNVVYFLWGYAFSISKKRNKKGIKDRQRRFYKDLVCCLENTVMSSERYKSVLKSHTFLQILVKYTIETFKELDSELTLFSSVPEVGVGIGAS